MINIADMAVFSEDENISISDRLENNVNDNSKNPVVLEPDHPLMQKFQITLNNFLEKENERIRIEILELKENLRKNKEDYEKQMCHEMFNLEQEVTQQRKLISDYENKLDDMEKIHIENNLIVKKNKEDYKEKYDELNENKKKEVQLLGELEALTLLCRQYELWEKDTNSEMIIKQHMSEKINQDKQILVEKKKKLDAMAYKLMTEVWNLKSQTNLTEDQIKIKLQELDDMNCHISNVNLNLQTLDIEKRQLMQLWNSVIINIQQKDKLLTSVNEEYENVQSEFRTIVANIESLKKEINSEMLQHESIMMMKNKTTFELANCSQLVKCEETKKNNLESALVETNSALEITEKDLNLEKAEYSRNNSLLKALTIQYEKLVNDKISLENETLDKLQERLSSDKNVESLAAKIIQLKDDTRKQEMSMLNLENQYTKIKLKIEKQRNFNSHKQLLVKSEKIAYEEKEKNVSVVENKLKETMYMIGKQQTSFDLINRKIELILEKLEGVETSPIERKIEALENEITNYAAKAKELRQNWIRLQKHVIQSTKQYQKYTVEVDLVQEQIQILERKCIKLKTQIKKQQQEEIRVQHLIDAEFTHIQQLSKQIYLNKHSNNIQEAKYNDLTIEYMAKLKDTEMNVMIIQEDITDIENEKEQLALQLYRTKKDIKHWQKMEIIAIETKQKVKEEKSATGDIGRMKMEIHRMQVRHGQVSRTAARLASDLAQAVWRRAAAVNRSRACPRNAAPRYTFCAKSKEKRADIRRLNQEIDVNQNTIQTLTSEYKIHEKNIQEKAVIIATMENEVVKFRQQIEENLLCKQKNLEKIVRHQRSGQHYSLVVSGRIHMHSVKSESNVSVKYNKQKKINCQLINLVKVLFSELPEHHMTLMRILNTLHVEEEDENK